MWPKSQIQLFLSFIVNNIFSMKSKKELSSDQVQEEDEEEIQQNTSDQHQLKDFNQPIAIISEEVFENKSIETEKLEKKQRKKILTILAIAVFCFIVINIAFGKVSKKIQQEQEAYPAQAAHSMKSSDEKKKQIQKQISSPLPTLGQPNLLIPFNNTPLNRQNWEEFEVYMNRLFKPYNDTNCQFIRFGDDNDGGYVTCLNSIANAKALINFGVQGRDMYGCHVTTQHKMPNLQYDCTNSIAPSCSTNNNNNKFKFVCIGSQTEKKQGKQYITIKDIIDENQLYQEHIWMKIDIEGGQWEGFKTLPIQYLDYIDQIVMEVHIGSRSFPSSAYWGNLEIIQNLMQHYVNVNLHVNNWACSPQMVYPADAFEVTLINKKLIKLNSEARSFKEHKLNNLNNKYSSQKCQTNDEWEQSIQFIDQKYPLNRKSSKINNEKQKNNQEKNKENINEKVQEKVKEQSKKNQEKSSVIVPPKAKINEKTVFMPTLGQPNILIPFNNTPLNQQSWEEVEVYMNRLFKPYNDTDCQFIRFGDSNDGGYVTCLNSIEQAKALINFGVQGRDWYGCHVTAKHKMPNLQYDCTNRNAPTCSNNENNNKFNFICIGEKTETIGGRDYMSIKDIIDKNNLYHKHIWMKIDIEGGQWSGFKTLPLEYLQYIDQIVMEVHIGSRSFPSSALWGNLQIIQNLMEYFVNINFHINNWGCSHQAIYPSGAFEVSLINKKLIKIKQPTRSFKEHDFNARNNPSAGLCNTDEEWEKSIQHIDNKYPSVRSNKPIFLNQPENKPSNTQNLPPSPPQEIKEIGFIQTVGIKWPNKLFNTTIVEVKDYYQFQSVMEKLFKPFNDTDCEFKRFGDSGDGGYVLCNNFIKQAEALVNFGVEGRDQFGCAITNKFPMPNLQFDCTNSKVPTCNLNNPNGKFHTICIANGTFTDSSGKKFKSIKDIIDENNLKGKHIIMKADMEGGQWHGFSTLPMEYLDYIDQIIMEVHNSGRSLPFSMWGNLEVTKSLMQKFVNVNFHINNWTCYKFSNFYLTAPGQHKINGFAFEVTLVNKRLITLKSESRSYKLHPENKPNGFSQECQMEDSL